MATTPTGNIVAYVKESLNEEEEFHFLRLEFLQRLNIASLQVDLVKMRDTIHVDGAVSAEDLGTLRNKMQQYATAIRDYEYLKKKKSMQYEEVTSRQMRLHTHFGNPEAGNTFQSHYAYYQDNDEEVDPLRRILMMKLPSHLTFSHQERAGRRKEFSEGKPPYTLSNFVDRLVRFIIAFTGGVFLVVPMIIMTISPSQTKSLVTVSVAVVIFSLLLSFVVRVSNAETLVSTATYAAVLVVFVGTSSNGGIIP